MSEHLTDEQFCSLLSGESPDSLVAAHLAGCAACRRELEAVSLANADFNALGARWAAFEAKRNLKPPSRLALRLGFKPALGLRIGALAAGCAIAVGLSLPAGHVRSSEAAGVSETVPSPDDVTQDNRMLRAMDEDLRYGPDVITVPVSALRKGDRAQDQQPVNVVLN